MPYNFFSNLVYLQKKFANISAKSKRNFSMVWNYGENLVTINEKNELKNLGLHSLTSYFFINNFFHTTHVVSQIIDSTNSWIGVEFFIICLFHYIPTRSYSFKTSFSFHLFTFSSRESPAFSKNYIAKSSELYKTVKKTYNFTQKIIWERFFYKSHLMDTYFWEFLQA